MKKAMMIAPLAAPRCSRCGHRTRPMSGNVCLNCACRLKVKKIAKVFYEIGCKICGYRNICNLGQRRKIECKSCKMGTTRIGK